MKTPTITLTDGATCIEKVLVAETFCQRLRGWLGYKRKHINAVWLLRTRSIHTAMMPFAIDLYWLDASGDCIAWEHRVKPWQVRWNIRAESVLEVASDYQYGLLTRRFSSALFSSALFSMERK